MRSRFVRAAVVCTLVFVLGTSAAVAHYCGEPEYEYPASTATPSLTIGMIGGGLAVAGGTVIARAEGHWPNIDFDFCIGPITISSDTSDGSDCGSGYSRGRTDDTGTGHAPGRAPAEPGDYKAESFYPHTGSLGASSTITVHAEGDPGVNPVDHSEDAATDASFQYPVHILSDDPLCRFEVCDWAEYPDDIMGWSVPGGVPMRLPRPTGPFRLRQGTNSQVGSEQQIARQKANNENGRLHYQAAKDGLEKGTYQFHEIAPVKMGGDPEAYGNKIRLLTADHNRVGRFWRKIQAAAELLAKPGECQNGSGGVDGGVG